MCCKEAIGPNIREVLPIGLSRQNQGVTGEIVGFTDRRIKEEENWKKNDEGVENQNSAKKSSGKNFINHISTSRLRMYLVPNAAPNPTMVKIMTPSAEPTPTLFAIESAEPNESR